jgi:hypothetical protein
MNALARAVYDIVVNHKSFEAVSGDLSAQEQAILKEMRQTLSRNPEDLARLLATAPTQSEWWSNPKGSVSQTPASV